MSTSAVSLSQLSVVRTANNGSYVEMLTKLLTKAFTMTLLCSEREKKTKIAYLGSSTDDCQSIKKFTDCETAKVYSFKNYCEMA